MNRTRWTFVAGLLGILTVGLIVWSAAPKEPEYDGRSLSSWLDEWGKSNHDRTNPATTAIRAIGSNGLPILLARLSKDPSPDERKFWGIMRKVVPDDWNPMEQDANQAVTAAEAINLLGIKAKPAFPTLTNLVSSRPHCLTASIALAGMGHEGVAVLLQNLTNQDWILRQSAAMGLAEAGSDIDTVIPALIEVTKLEVHKEEDYLVRGAAGSALVQLHKQPDLVVPAFSELLTRPDAETRGWAANLLGGFCADAKSAVPLLLKACTDEDSDVRQSAASALKEIDPAALTNAGSTNPQVPGKN